MIWTPPDLDQPERGYRYSTDAFILSSFVLRFKARTWCDLGTGSGVIAYTLATKMGGRGSAIERQPDLLVYARKNLRSVGVKLLEGDLTLNSWPRDQFELLVCNPPYYEVGAGHINKDPMMALARHTFFGGVFDFAHATRDALRDDGHFCFIFPYHLHGPVLRQFLATGWHLRQRLLVRSFAGKNPKLICLAMAKRPTNRFVEEELVIYAAHREFTPAMEQFLVSGCLK